MRHGLGWMAILAVLAVAVPVDADEEHDLPPIVNEVVLGASPSDAWKVFTTPEGWKALGVAKAQVDLRVGGRILTHYSPEGVLGDEGSIEHTILAFEPERLLVFRTTRAPKSFPFDREALARTWTVIAIGDLGDGRTRVTLRMHGYRSDEPSKRLRGFFEAGNAQTWALLAKRYPAVPGEAGAEGLARIEANGRMAVAPREAFAAWTDGDRLGAALGVPARVRLEVGGSYEIEFDPTRPAGERGSEGCVVQAWLPGRMLAFTWSAPPSFPAARSRRTLVVVEFEADASGGTLVRLTHSGFAEHAKADAAHRDEWVRVRSYFDSAWPKFLSAVAAAATRR